MIFRGRGRAVVDRNAEARRKAAQGSHPSMSPVVVCRRKSRAQMALKC